MNKCISHNKLPIYAQSKYILHPWELLCSNDIVFLIIYCCETLGGHEIVKQ